MKNAVVAKLVHQVSDFYADAMKLLQLGSIREIWPKVLHLWILPSSTQLLDLSVLSLSLFLSLKKKKKNK